MTTEDNIQKHGVLITPCQQMIASCSGAFLTSIFVTPLDVVKIRLQAQSKPFTKGMCFLYCNGLMDHICTCLNGQNAQSQTWYKKPGHFTGTLDAFVKISRTEGISSLWSGLPPTLVMAVPATVVYFTCYEQLKGVLLYRDGNVSDWWKPIIAGVLARIWAVTLISPLELVRTKMQSEQLTYREIITAIQKMISQGGLLSMWRGLGPTLLRDLPFSALYWFSYEQMKSHVLRTRGSTKLKLIESFIAGASAGTVAAVLTLPFDVVKTNRQITIGTLDTLSNQTSTWVILQHMYRQQGIQSLFRGLVPRIIKVAPACAIMITSYEYLKSMFQTINERKKVSVS
ncbi:probable mitochondrial glutathione transporter SLC25A40 isoform X2 [Patella vulgata]|uniref:probable mitochondrial glutathione transporter SLC25A40 isoform X2 n=1 Tax=Patella vulgata TaxID=6465 RepID=UPI0021801C3E|nr:probable mitochondrial glutathione transporter SLC25A40 isoform X2 [Patella vulgata]